MRGRVLLLLLALSIPANQTLPAPPPAEIETLWTDLASVDAARAFQALLTLARADDQAVAVIDKHLLPVAVPDQKQVARLIKDLENDHYPVRARAVLELTRLGELAEPNLRRRLTGVPSLEVQRRIELLLKNLQGATDAPGTIQAMRALEVLEKIGTPRARGVLEKIAGGFEGSRLTQEAKDTLKRLDKRERTGSRVVLTAEGPRKDQDGEPLPAGAVLRLGSAHFRHPETYGKIIFAPDGRSLAIPGQEEIRIMDVKTGKVQRRLRTQGNLMLMAFTTTGKLVAVSAVYSQQPPTEVVQTWDLIGNAKPHTVSWQNQTYLYGRDISGDGKLMAAFVGDGSLRAWDLTTGKEVSRQALKGRYLYNLVVARDGSLVAGAGDQNGIVLWNRKTGTVKNLRLSRSQTSHLAFSPDAKLLFANVSYSGQVAFWDTSSGRLLRTVHTGNGYTSGAFFSPDGKTLATLHQKPGIWIWDPATGTVTRKIDIHGTNPHSLAFSPDSRLLAVDFGAAVRILDLHTGKTVAGFHEGHTRAVTLIAFAPGGDLATVGEDNAVHIWIMPGGRERRVFQHTNWVRAAAFSPNGKLLATSCFDDAVYVFDAASGREIYKLAGHTQLGGLRALRFSPDGRTLLSWGDDFYLRTWNMANGRALRELRVGPPGLQLPDDDEDENPNAIRNRRIAREVMLMTQGGATFSADGRDFVIGSANEVDFVSTTTGKHATVKGGGGAGPGGTFTFSPDGKWALLGRGQRFDILHLPSKTWGYSLPRDQRRWGNVPAISADGRTVAFTTGTRGEEIELWEKLTGKKRLTLRGFDASVRCLGYSGDGRYLVAGLSDASALVWDLLDLPADRKAEVSVK